MKQATRIPTSRVSRALGLGAMAGSMAVGGLTERARRALSGQADKDFSAVLSPANGVRLARRLAKMRGAAMKLGQLLSMEGEDLLPREFSQALAILRAEAHAMPDKQLRRLLVEQYGRDWASRFEEFEPRPLAAASIGQVHWAVARGGRELAMKIQYPGVARSIDSDVDNLALLLRSIRLLPAGLDLSPFIAEAKQQLHREADYQAEARAQEHFSRRLADEDGLRVPRPDWDLTTPRILAMDFLDGEPLQSLEGEYGSQALRDAIGTSLYRLMFRELFEFSVVQTDPNPANYSFKAGNGVLNLLDFGATRSFEPAFMGHYARLCRAAVAGDHRAAEAAARDIGYLPPHASPGLRSILMDMILLACEPLGQTGDYDCAGSNLPDRVRRTAWKLSRFQNELTPPPPQTVFLHRKLAGTFLLCARIGARVPLHRLFAAQLA